MDRRAVRPARARRVRRSWRADCAAATRRTQDDRTKTLTCSPQTADQREQHNVS
jgi:hypothetical protein